MKNKNENYHHEFERFCRSQLGIETNSAFMQISQHLDMDNAVCLSNRQAGYSTIKIAKVVYTLLRLDNDIILSNYSNMLSGNDKILLLSFLEKCGIKPKHINDHTIEIEKLSANGLIHKQRIKFIPQESLIEYLYKLSTSKALNVMLYADDIKYDIVSGLASFKRYVDGNDELFVNIKAFKQFDHYDSVFISMIEKDFKDVFYNYSVIHKSRNAEDIKIIKRYIGDKLYKQEYMPSFNK